MHKKLIDNIFSDFKDFFVDEKHAQFIKYRIIENISIPMKVYRTGRKSYIAISSDIQFFEINDDTSKIYILFMIGHELAHLVNKHLEYKDKNNFDSQTLEMWADYFGTKISMSILQNGTKFNQMLTANFKDVNIGLEIIFHALVMLNDTLYINTNSSSKYLNSNERVSTVIAAIAAFLTRKEMIMNFKFSEKEHADIGCGWGMAINKKCYDLGMFDKLYKTTKKDDIDMFELTKNVLIIHNQLKQKNKQIVKGLDLKHSYILDTSYEVSKPNQMMINKFNEKLDEMGWDIQL
ncbi:MAG: hypothetical protein FP820_07525 [Sulfurimonas sp.]|nr:hypothetical protein [Sulfurimonas sp.]MBU3939917.1 hypothetical protein [bacterium]MBU4024844.1 hypothetical protein [bacterium]MBU4060057.1 hypothetical protein [bacterium]MBU4110901.1 hypothetical protein [bacterium]